MQKTFSYMFLDNQFYKKAGLFFIYITTILYCTIFKSNVYSLSTFIVACLIIPLATSIVEGYNISTIKSINVSNRNFYVLPFLNLKKDFIYGLKYFIALFWIHLFFTTVISIPAFITGFSPFMSNPNNTLTIIGIIFTTLFIIIYAVFNICIEPACKLLFSRTNNIWCFYQFEEILKIVFLNKAHYFLSIIMNFIITVLTALAISFLIKTTKSNVIWGMITLVGASLMITYFNYVKSYLIAHLDAPEDTIKENKNNKKVEELEQELIKELNN